MAQDCPKQEPDLADSVEEADQRQRIINDTFSTFEHVFNQYESAQNDSTERERSHEQPQPTRKWKDRRFRMMAVLAGGVVCLLFVITLLVAVEIIAIDREARRFHNQIVSELYPRDLNAMINQTQDSQYLAKTLPSTWQMNALPQEMVIEYEKWVNKNEIRAAVLRWVADNVVLTSRMTFEKDGKGNIEFWKFNAPIHWYLDGNILTVEGDMDIKVFGKSLYSFHNTQKYLCAIDDEKLTIMGIFPKPTIATEWKKA